MKPINLSRRLRSDHPQPALGEQEDATVMGKPTGSGGAGEVTLEVVPADGVLLELRPLGVRLFILHQQDGGHGAPR